MKKEYVFFLIAGLFLLAYILEAVVNPLELDLATPYDYLSTDLLTHYPFTTTIILIRAFALLLTLVWFTSLLSGYHFAKAVTLLVIAGLTQLYAIQEIATNTQIIPLEWSLSLSLAGLGLLLPACFQFLIGLAKKTKQKFQPKKQTETKQPSISD